MWSTLNGDEMTEIVQLIDWCQVAICEEFAAWLKEILVLIDMGFEV